MNIILKVKICLTKIVKFSTILNCKKKNKQTGKSVSKKKNNKKKSKKTENKKYRYVSHKKRFMDKVCDAVDVKVRSKINVDVTDESISNLLSSGINLVTLLLSRKK